MNKNFKDLKKLMKIRGISFDDVIKIIENDFLVINKDEFLIQINYAKQPEDIIGKEEVSLSSGFRHNHFSTPIELTTQKTIFKIVDGDELKTPNQIIEETGGEFRGAFYIEMLYLLILKKFKDMLLICPGSTFERPPDNILIPMVTIDGNGKKIFDEAWLQSPCPPKSKILLVRIK